MDKKVPYDVLLERWFSENESKEDVRALYEGLQQEATHEAFSAALERQFHDQPHTIYPDAERIAKAIVQAHPAEKVRVLPRWSWIAASLLLLLGATFFLWPRSGKDARDITIAPGHEGAILTLADGSQIVLDSLGNGTLASQNGTSVVLNSGMLRYDAAGAKPGKALFNIITTPKGRQFSLQLPDGSKVWLNAASSLRYPTAFNGSERKVEVTGEAYFEVARQAGKPFLVSVAGKAIVEVLGTQFNISAYENEQDISTTLLEGSIRISGTILKPGQQARINGQEIKVENDPDINRAIAWKDGLFNFEGATLKEVMHQLERWYDIEVVYEKDIPDIRFVGEMKRNIPLKDLLEILEKLKVHFRLEEGRKLIVMP